jgi:plastocyanin
MERGIVAALVLGLTIAAAGCGSKAKKPAAGDEAMSGEGSKGEGKTAEKTVPKSAPKSPSKSAVKSGTKSAAKPAEKPAEKPAAKPVAAVSGGGHIRLIDRSCVSFEPHWTTIRVGQSLTWHSEVKKAVTIHVTPGAFDRDEYVVPARGTVHTGPAQEPGDYGMWTMPAACQAAPHGVQGAGPGVTIEGR